MMFKKNYESKNAFKTSHLVATKSNIENQSNIHHVILAFDCMLLMYFDIFH